MQSKQTLFVLWRIIIPIVPLLLLLAPTLWRNVCPIATLHQLPRLFGVSKAKNLPRWFRGYNELIGISIFVILVSSRKIIFNYNGPVLAILIIGVLVAAIMLGDLFLGKSGWCTSICPVFPVEMLYGQRGVFEVNNSHCQPCNGCTELCFDNDPKKSYLAILHHRNKQRSQFRRLFAGMFPGFILAYYLAPNPAGQNWAIIGEMFLYFLGFCLISASSFYLLERVLPLSTGKIAIFYAAAALNLYYWFNAPLLGELFGSPNQSSVAWAIRLLVGGISLVWVYRASKKETIFARGG
ncbi:MAG: hypothetical protein GY796_12380 [Chloroflexi bacterium]|nr:hypothetical protein [Chloroflexota bacterium]